MANLFLTSYCERNCSYCFLEGWVDSDSSQEQVDRMSLGDIDEIISFLNSSDHPQSNEVQLMGGEPLEHPELIEIVHRFKESGIKIYAILTNCLGETKLIRQLKQITPETKFLVNVNNPDTYTDENWELLESNLEVLSEDLEGAPVTSDTLNDFNRLQFAVTFTRPDQSYDYVMELAERYNVFFLRYSPGHPSTDMSGEYVDFEGLKELKPTLMNFVRDAVDAGYNTNLDCILAPCVFDIDEWQFLAYHSDSLESVCGNHLDILPSLEVIHCAPLFDQVERLSIRDYSLREIQQKQARQANEIRSIRLPRCRGCEFFENSKCQGYCLRLKLDEAEAAGLI